MSWEYLLLWIGIGLPHLALMGLLAWLVWRVVRILERLW